MSGGPDMSRALHILSRALQPRYAGEAVRKAIGRLGAGRAAQDARRMQAWCRAHESDVEAFARARNAPLWEEALAFAVEQRVRAEALAQSLSGFGGGGFYALLYFLVRLQPPEVVVETGVAAGFSSRAVLRALAANGRGGLWSSDLPYFGGQAPEALIGVMVEPELRERWTLLTHGDRANLPKILQQIARIDLLHYDSDKTVSGRAWALEQARPRLAPGAFVLFDDIQDNLHFAELAGKTPYRSHVFGFEGKWIGLVEWGRGAA